jgi:hypothetical protein
MAVDLREYWLQVEPDIVGTNGEVSTMKLDERLVVVTQDSDGVFRTGATALEKENAIVYYDDTVYKMDEMKKSTDVLNKLRYLWLVSDTVPNTVRALNDQLHNCVRVTGKRVFSDSTVREIMLEVKNRVLKDFHDNILPSNSAAAFNENERKQQVYNLLEEKMSTAFPSEYKQDIESAQRVQYR